MSPSLIMPFPSVTVPFVALSALFVAVLFVLAAALFIADELFVVPFVPVALFVAALLVPVAFPFPLPFVPFALPGVVFSTELFGFVLSVVVLYVTQYFVAGYSISWMAAIIGALIYGIIDYIIPGEQKM